VQVQEIVLKKTRFVELTGCGSWFNQSRTIMTRPWIGRHRHYRPRAIKIPNYYYNRQVKSTATTPTISIVTPSLNYGDYIERTIRSVLGQNYGQLEYVVQDGGSSDGTVKILQHYEKSIYYWGSRKDNGQANAVNLGFKHTTGEILAYLNSDDLLLPGALDAVAGFFWGHPDVDVVYGHRVLIDEHDQEVGRWILPPHEDMAILWADYVPQETLFWRRGIWDRVGSCLDESFTFAMDWELLLRFREAGAKFARIPRFIGAFRIHRQQKTLSGMAGVGLEEMNRLLMSYHGRTEISREEKRNLRYYLLRHMACHLMYRLRLLRY